MYDFRDVNGRNKRRKQSKSGKFNADVTSDSKTSESKPEFSFSDISESKLTKLKQDIRSKAKKTTERIF